MSANTRFIPRFAALLQDRLLVCGAGGEASAPPATAAASLPTPRDVCPPLCREPTSDARWWLCPNGRVNRVWDQLLGFDRVGASTWEPAVPWSRSEPSAGVLLHSRRASWAAQGKSEIHGAGRRVTPRLGTCLRPRRRTAAGRPDAPYGSGQLVSQIAGCSAHNSA